MHKTICFCLLAACIALTANTRAADVDALLQAMTLDEKLAMLHGQRDPDPALGLNSAGFVQGVPWLGIPDLRLADGPAGIRTDVSATALPAPVALAASFDRELAFRYGDTIGMEGLARNQQVLLSPMVNLVRVPQAGRNFETFGEDPLLAAELVTEEIRGIQGRGMMATVKHFAVNNQEQDRLTIDAKVAERALRELYLPAFEAAVDAGVASIMCAYNQVNGAFSCENPQLLQNILRDAWGFEGWVMTDWWAQHSLGALSKGLNMEMPGYAIPTYNVPVHFEAPLRAALADGSIPSSAVDAAVRPLLVMMDRFGYLDGTRPATVSRTVDNSAVALDTALKGAVLLKNADDVLPLQNSTLDSLLVLGPTAGWTLLGGGGSSRVLPSERDSPLEALRTLSNRADLTWMVGIDPDGSVIPQQALLVPGTTTPGLKQMLPDGSVSEIATLDTSGGAAPSGIGMWYWNAELVAPESGDYELSIQTSGPVASLYLDGERLVLNDVGVLSSASLLPTRGGLRNSSRLVHLNAGQKYQLHAEAWTDNDTPLQMRLAWLTPSQRAQNLDEAVEAAQKVDTVVVFAYVEGTEGGDRATLALPGDQDRFISALATETEARVVVVLNTGAPVTMPWADDVAAILQMWYPGQAGGEATARLLLGLDAPSGKLPVTFPRSEADVPATDTLHYPGVDNVQEYAEGLFIGYRWYDRHNIEPLFPFGHGLSYTSFAYRDLAVEHGNGDSVTLSFTLSNTGSRSGTETPQVYLSHGDDVSVETEVRKLVAFAKVTLAPGESRRVSVQLPARRFAYWNSAADSWQALPGAKLLAVGASSRDLRIEQSFVYSPTTLDQGR